MTRRVALLRAKNGTYTDRKTGQEKTSYTTIGSVLERDNGDRMYKIDSIPVSFDGWVYEGDLPQVQPTQGDMQQARPQQVQQAEFVEDDIPF